MCKLGCAPPGCQRSASQNRDESGWNKDSDVPPPSLPPAVVAATRDRYVEAYTRLTGLPFN